MRQRPVHAGTFQASFHDQFVATLDDTAANRPSLGLEQGVLHLRLALLQISQITGDLLSLWMLLGKGTQFCQKFRRSIFFEPM